MSKRGHSVCLECRRFISLNMDGRLRTHKTLEGIRCQPVREGAGQSSAGTDGSSTGGGK